LKGENVMSIQEKQINILDNIIDHNHLQYVLTSVCNFCVSFNYYGSVQFSKVFEDFNYYKNENEYCFGETDAEMPDVFIQIDQVDSIVCDLESQQIVITLNDGNYCVIDWI
jgi:hypothetical protein